MASNYDFPIFVSSIDYNLVDLRAELKDYLDDLGYRVVLSSSEGFPDQTPNLSPWESCLPVLDKCLVMILVVDGRYGASLEWKNFEKTLGTDKIAPTHGEYRYARAQGKRILIFIRASLMNDYQRYREAMKPGGSGSKPEGLEVVKRQLFLPKTIDFETLRFIDEIKNTKPIPWIRQFRDVTEVKREVHRQLLNELARWFIDRECQLQDLIARFSVALEKSTPEQRNVILGQIGFTKDLIDQVELKTKTIADSNAQIEQRQKQIENLAHEKEKNRQQIAQLEQEKDELRARVNELQLQNAASLIGATGTATNDISTFLSGAGASGRSFWEGAEANRQQQKCDKCATPFWSNRFFASVTPMKCPTCLRTLCASCYGAFGRTLFSSTAECIECHNERSRLKVNLS